MKRPNILKNFSSSLKSVFSEEHDRGPLSTVKRDSRFVLTSFILLLLLSTVLHYGYYVRLEGAQGPETEKDVAFPVIEAGALKNAVQGYEKKQAEFDKLFYTKPTAINPD